MKTFLKVLLVVGLVVVVVAVIMLYCGSHTTASAAEKVSAKKVVSSTSAVMTSDIKTESAVPAGHKVILYNDREPHFWQIWPLRKTIPIQYYSSKNKKKTFRLKFRGKLEIRFQNVTEKDTKMLRIGGKAVPFTFKTSEPQEYHIR